MGVAIFPGEDIIATRESIASRPEMNVKVNRKREPFLESFGLDKSGSFH